MLHIRVLADRDWTHPEAGGTGTALYAKVSRWLAWGHRVTVVAGAYDGAVPREQLAPNLEVHRMGSRLTVFPRAANAVRKGVGRDADLVFEVVNGIAFCTPLWWFARKPRVHVAPGARQLIFGDAFALNALELAQDGRFGARRLDPAAQRRVDREQVRVQRQLVAG